MEKRYLNQAKKKLHGVKEPNPDERLKLIEDKDATVRREGGREGRREGGRAVLKQERLPYACIYLLTLLFLPPSLPPSLPRP
jgi:hypothetical protein